MAEKNITLDEVKRIISLCNLDIYGQEEKFSKILSDTLGYLKVLDDVDTSSVKETYQVSGLTNIFQSGQESKSLLIDETLSNAKDREGDLFSTKAVFER